ncbi:BQ5605_C008g05274 [Microbotryum silenes-dioicae]|uniref:BQ5605_C008g05274 protein n=1 Tax=Microbotryum silenes-dioicae TaxID=796604 RepID=A0A2X0P851_9BASI|nr:BQ5605_C008g05274 [Microbotryum silenes-dioicae]
MPGWGGHWYTRPVPTSNRAKKQKSCLYSPARGSSSGWVNGPADLARAHRVDAGRSAGFSRYFNYSYPVFISTASVTTPHGYAEKFLKKKKNFGDAHDLLRIVNWRN